MALWSNAFTSRPLRRWRASAGRSFVAARIDERSRGGQALAARLAPSDELRQWFHANPEAWALFRKRYLKELASEEATAAVEKLHDLAEGKKKLTLLYASRNEERNNATVLKELLEGMAGSLRPAWVAVGDRARTDSESEKG